MTALAPQNKMTIFQVLTQLDGLLEKDGIDILSNGQFDGTLARPRTFEIAAALNRLRSSSKQGTFLQLT